MDKKIEQFEQSIDDLIAELSDALPPPNHNRVGENHNQNIVLTGVARIGKSVLAKKLSSAHGYVVITTDRLRNLFWDIADNDVRSKIRLRAYTKLLGSVSSGLLIEGDNLLFNHQEHRSVSLDFSLVTKIRDQGLAKCFLVGCSRETWQRKLEEIDRYRKEHDCWTSDETAQSRERLAREIVDNSIRLRLAGKRGFTYIELTSDSFAESVSRGLEQITKELLTTDCKNARLYHVHGNLLQKQGRLEKAEAAQRRAIELDPSYVEAYRSLSSVLARQHRQHEALTAAQQALELDPDNAKLHRHLGNLLQRQGF